MCDRFSSSLLNSSQKFFTVSPFGIILRDPFLDGRPQNISKGALVANITKLEGGARAKKVQLFGQHFIKGLKMSVFS